MKRLFLGVTLFVLGLGVLSAVLPQKWSLASSPDFWKGKLNGVSASGEGPLFLAARQEKKDGPSEEFYLSLAEAADGTLYLGSGHGGKVYRLAKDAPSELYFQTAEMDVTCLALDDKGVLYAGTSPNGRVYKITAKDKGETLFNPDEKYIWDLLPGPDGKLLAAVGESGAVYEINDQGEGRTVLKVNDSHVLCLARQANGDLLAGSAGNGQLYRLSSAGKASVLMESSFEEVKSIALDGEGNIYLAACGTPAKPKKDEAAKTDAALAAAAAAVEITVTADRSAAGRPEVAVSGGPSALIRVNQEGVAKELWDSDDEFIFDLLWDESQKRVVFSTGNQGRLYAADADGQTWLLVQGASEQVSRLIPAGDKTFMLSNNPPRLDVLYAEQMMEGDYLSPVLDAKTVSSWGRIVWEAELPPATVLQLQTRSGNSNEPSATWSDWSPPYQKADGEQVLSPKARYLQFRALFKTTAGRLSPKLNKVELYYLPANLAPTVSTVNFLPPNVVLLKPPDSGDIIWGASAPLGDEDEDKNMMKIAASVKKSEKKGYRTLVWAADDENEDRLLYTIFSRREDESQWRLLEKDRREMIYAFDTIVLPDGFYIFKVVASDGPSNPAGLALQGEKVSKRLTVDNTPPVLRNVQLAREGSRLKISFQADDGLSPISEAKVLVRPADWQEVFPTDGICDSLRESFSFTLDLAAGSDNLTVIMVQDAHGNSAVFRKVF
jgi:outer membrane protein assembly factor BamB